MDAGYEFIEHTADIGIVAWAPEPGRAFAEAARGMFALILGQDPGDWAAGGREQPLDVQVVGPDWAGLLVAWLSELLFHFDVDRFIPRVVEMRDCSPPACNAHLTGLRLESPADASGIGVKAVTYHQLAVDIRPGRTTVRVILDV